MLWSIGVWTGLALGKFQRCEQLLEGRLGLYVEQALGHVYEVRFQA